MLEVHPSSTSQWQPLQGGEHLTRDSRSAAGLSRLMPSPTDALDTLSSRQTGLPSKPIRSLMRSVQALQDKVVSAQDPPHQSSSSSLRSLAFESSQPCQHRHAIDEPGSRDSSIVGGALDYDRHKAVDADCPGPWLRTWVEFQVDARVNEAFRELAKGEYQFRGHTASRQSDMDTQQVMSHLEKEVATIAEAHSKLCATVQHISIEIAAVRKAGEHQVVSADAADAFRKPVNQQHEDVQLLKAEMTRHEETLADLRRNQWEATANQRRCLSDIESIRSSLRDTQEEVSGLALLAERLEQCLSQCHDQVAAAASEVANAKPAAPPALPPIEEMQLPLANVDGLEERLAQLGTLQAELESRIEEVRADLPDAAVITSADFARHIKDLRADLDEVHDGFGSTLHEKQEAMQRRLNAWCEDMEARTHQELQSCGGETQQLRKEIAERLQKFESRLARDANDVEGKLLRCEKRLEKDTAEMEAKLMRLEKAVSRETGEVETKLHNVETAVSQELERKLQHYVGKKVHEDNVEMLSAQLHHQQEEQFDKLHVEVKKKLQSIEQRMDKDAKDCEVKVSQVQTVLRKEAEDVEEMQSRAEGLRRSFSDLQHQVEAMKSEMESKVVVAGQSDAKHAADVADLTQRIDDVAQLVSKQFDAWRSKWDQDIQAAQKKVASELRLELRSALRSEAAAVAALDEQLWLTDQRLGQRIEELWSLQQAAGRHREKHHPESQSEPQAEVVATRHQRGVSLAGRSPQAKPASANVVVTQSPAGPLSEVEHEPLPKGSEAAKQPPSKAPGMAAPPDATHHAAQEGPSHKESRGAAPPTAAAGNEQTPATELVKPRMVVTQSAINPGIPFHDRTEKHGRNNRVRFIEEPEVQTVPAAEPSDSEPHLPCVEEEAVLSSDALESAAPSKFERSQDLIAERRASRGALPLDTQSERGCMSSQTPEATVPDTAPLQCNAEIRFGSATEGGDTEVSTGSIGAQAVSGSLQKFQSSADRAAAIAAARARLRVPNLRPRAEEAKSAEDGAEQSGVEAAIQAPGLGG
mmetsp:Transcript_52298/g.124771  ORF Transcript_52298/g.124771 Transcript_52298/m.124771 type:complete len:1039 (+) Transcript_52298:111-3227(+)